MRVVCLRTGGYHLTISKIYDVNPYNGSSINLFDYIILNDIGHTHCVEGNLFKLLSDFRNEKLEKLGI